MKTKLFIISLLVTAAGLLASCEEPSTPSVRTNEVEYIDLGLPSGALWANQNEQNPQDTIGFYTYTEAINRYGKNIPTKEQWKELIDQCEWTLRNKTYIVTGSNGNSIKLPISGYRQSSGTVIGVGIDGEYWSSTLDGTNIAWCLIMDLEGPYMDGEYCNYALSVRLVK